VKKGVLVLNYFQFHAKSRRRSSRGRPTSPGQFTVVTLTKRITLPIIYNLCAMYEGPFRTKVDGRAHSIEKLLTLR
jgi:hypothetical protein